jgi:3-dehydroquinate dehydratase-2
MSGAPVSGGAPVLVLNGPNLNLLGHREPRVYGVTTYEQLVADLVTLGRALGLSVRCAQSNHEGALIDLLQEARGWAQGVVFNPGGYAHTSVALRDAVALLSQDLAVPVIEVHISNVARREPFRHHSYISAVAEGVISGLGVEGYSLALRALSARVASRPSPQDP